jgi:hypothetical protein
MGQDHWTITSGDRRFSPRSTPVELTRAEARDYTIADRGRRVGRDRRPGRRREPAA